MPLPAAASPAAGASQIDAQLQALRVKSKTNPEIVEVSQFEPQTLKPGNQHSVITNPGLFRTLARLPNGDCRRVWDW
jgi:hypothetical protein